VVVLYFSSSLGSRHLNFLSNKSNHKSLLLSGELLHFATFNLSFVDLLPLTNKVSKYTDLIVVVFIEIETVTMSKSNLKQIIVKAFF